MDINELESKEMMQIRPPYENVLNEWYNWLVNADKKINNLYNWIVSHIPQVVKKKEY